MSSSSSSSSTSSSSSPPPPFTTSREDSGGNAACISAVRRPDWEEAGPSTSRRRGRRRQLRAAVSEVWPEPFIEALAAQVAVAASRSFGRLNVAAALANLFRVCSTWRAVSRSEMLWHRLTRRIWGRTHRLQDTWHDEYVYWHRTARNFRTGRSSHTTLFFDPSDVDDPDGLTCRCLTLSDNFLACGFADGTVRLFDLGSRLHVSTYRAHHSDGLGPFPRAVRGIVISNNFRLTFATLAGDVHVATIPGPPITQRVHTGDVVNDGALVDFTGCGRWWVGLYAGAPGRAIHIWDSNTHELVFVGGSLTDPAALMGWNMLTEMTGFVGRVRVTAQQTAVACTDSRVIVFDLRNQGVVLADDEYRRRLVVTSFDVSDSSYVIVGSSPPRGDLARVRRADAPQREICRFMVSSGGQRGAAMGCMNNGHALMCAGGVIKVWEVEGGEYLYRFSQRVGAVNAFVCDERHVAAWSSDTTLHLWDFGA